MGPPGLPAVVREGLVGLRHAMGVLTFPDGGTAVLRDAVSGSFITVLLRGNDPRLGDLRTGDYVDLSGAWNRSGVFDAFNVADLRPAAGYNGGYDGYGRPDGY